MHSYQKGLFLNHIELATVKMYMYFRKKKKTEKTSFYHLYHIYICILNTKINFPIYTFVNTAIND